MSPIRLVIAEDYMALRYGLQTMLAAYADAVEVVADACNFDETVRQITQH
jgi:DNA-binding NarL/FixJ family response regulator